MGKETSLTLFQGVCLPPYAALEIEGLSALLRNGHSVQNRNDAIFALDSDTA